MTNSLPFYVFWSAATSSGFVLEYIDRRWIKRPICGASLLLGIAGGYITSRRSPFTFAGGDYDLMGLLLALACAVSLSGYLLSYAGRRLLPLVRKGLTRRV